MSTTDDILKEMNEATRGFDLLLSNQLPEARAVFGENDHPFHLMGRGVCAFLQAALGMEPEMMPEAVKTLGAAEAGAKKQAKISSRAAQTGRFPAGLEWEVVSADTIILNGATNILSESYMGYLQCLYALNSAHSKFTKLFKTVFPNGLDDPGAGPGVASRAPSRKPSTASLRAPVMETATSSSSTLSSSGATTPMGGFFRWGSAKLGPSAPPSPSPSRVSLEDGPIEDLIMSGVAFGYGVFNLIFSLLPARARSVVGFFGFQHDRKLALKSLAFSAARDDVHSSFAGLGLMTYLGVILLLTGWQANEKAIVVQYQGIVDKLLAKYPTGSLWILNKAKIQRMSGQAEDAIVILQDGLKPDRVHKFAQADALLVFELAWTLLSQRKYQEAADAFVKMTEINTWSHSTYFFIAAGCYIALGNHEKAQELFDLVLPAMEKKKISGKDLPTEVFIKKKLALYKQKQAQRTGSEEGWITAIRINPAEELAIIWNNHARISKPIAESYIKEFITLTPPSTVISPYASKLSISAPEAGTDAKPDLDSLDEHAVRSLLLGIVHRSAGAFEPARGYFEEVHGLQTKLDVNTWVSGIALFEEAVLDLKEAQAVEDASADKAGVDIAGWAKALHAATQKLDKASAVNGNNIDLSSRLDMRISMLRDEIAAKREMIGIPMP